MQRDASDGGQPVTARPCRPSRHWTELEERHPGLTPGRILQGDHAVFGCIVIHDNLRTHGEFGLEFAGAAEVAVYAKLPRGFQIPTPVGNYAPDWAVAFRDDSGLKHLFFVAETKGTLESFDLRGIENSKIACTKRLFNDLDLADGARYEQATTYQTLLDEVKALQ